MKKKLLLLAATALMTFGMAFSSLAQTVSFNPRVKVVIDNIDELGEAKKKEIINKPFVYRAYQISERYTRQEGRLYYPDFNTGASSQSMYFKHGQVIPLNFGSTKLNELIPNLIFMPGATDYHLSLENITIHDPSKFTTFKYDSRTGGNRVNYEANPKNWIRALKAVSGSATPDLTLHFKYNPDITAKPKVDTEPFALKKQIDYLYDNNEGYGKNDYRVYMSLKTRPDVEPQKVKDAIFVLDISGSMHSTFGSTTRFKKLQDVTKKAAKTILDTNSKNTVSIITFDQYVQSTIKKSNNLTEIYNFIDKFPIANRTTNYFEPLLSASSIVNSLIGDREAAVFFITDGGPNADTPAIQNGSGNLYMSEMYAKNAGEIFPQCAYFFSIYIGVKGENNQSAALLQGVTQGVDATKEKGMILASSEQQLSDWMDRFIAIMNDTISDITITDVNGDYTNIVGDFKLQVKEGDGPLNNADYFKENVIGNTVTIKMNTGMALKADTEYLFSYIVRSNKKATDHLDDNGDQYPDKGDPDTDYDLAHITSSNKEGFYQAKSSKLNYSIGEDTSEPKNFPKPVIQNVKWRDFPINNPMINLYTINTGRVLENNDYTYSVDYVGSKKFDEDDDGENYDDYYDENENLPLIEQDFKIDEDIFLNDAKGDTKVELKRKLSPKNNYIFHVKQTPKCDTSKLKEDERTLTVVLQAHTDGSVDSYYQFGKLKPSDDKTTGITENYAFDSSWKTDCTEEAFFNPFNIKANIY